MKKFSSTIKSIKETDKSVRKNILLLIGGQSVSRLGDSMQLVALFWLVYTLTGSENLTSMLALASVLPVVILGFYSGAIVDRYDRRYILIISDTIQSVLYVIVPILYYTNVLRIEHLFIVIFLIGVTRSFFYPALRAIVPSIVEREQLTAVNSINTICSQAATIIGPVLAGFLTYYIGSINLFVLNSLTFVISGITVWKLAYKNKVIKNKSGDNEEKEKISETIINGFKYVYKKKQVFYLIITFPVFTIISAGLTDIALLPYVKNILNGSSIEYGLLQSCVSVGVFLGGFLAIAVGKWNKFNLFIISILIVGIDFMIFGFNSFILICMILMCILGMAFAFLEICMVTVIQENVQEDMLGRVFNLWSVMGTAGDALSYIYISSIFAIFSVSGAFILGGLILVIASCIGFYVKIRKLNKISLQVEE